MNRKVKYLSILVVLFALNANAQKVKFGLRGGVNIATIAKSETNTLKPRLGVNLGGFVDFGITEHFSIQPGLQVTTKGARDNGNYRFRSTYIEIPVYALYNLNLGDVKLFGGAGPYFALGVGGQELGTDANGNTYQQTIAWDQAGAWRRPDAGLGLILGVEFQPAVQVGLNYDLGIANIHNPVDGNDGRKAYNRVLGIFIGYTFNAGK